MTLFGRIIQEMAQRQMKWDTRFVEMAELISTWSKDSTQVGCVIVGPNKEVRSVGYNGLPRGIEESEERTTRPEKYLWTEHAERNAIYNAARMGTSLDGCTLYCSWVPCMDCGRAIIQSGIRVIVGRKHADDGKWEAELKKTINMLEEAGVEVRFV